MSAGMNAAETVLMDLADPTSGLSAFFIPIIGGTVIAVAILVVAWWRRQSMFSAKKVSARDVDTQIELAPSSI